MKPISYALIACLFLSLSGCGLDAASTAATSASLKKQELEQGRKTMDRAKYQINQANSQAAARLEDLKLDQENDQ